MKRILVLVLLTLLIFPVFSDSIGYVYEDNYASFDITNARKGSVYRTEDKSIFCVKKVDDNGLVHFEKLISKGHTSVGDSLSKRAALVSISLRGTMEHASLGIRMTGAMYPFSPEVAVAVDYRNGLDLVLLAGLDTRVVLSRLWMNASLQGWCLLGASITGKLDFAVSYGAAYSHNIGALRLELGLSILDYVSKPGSTALCLGLGVDI